jgi:hypothetical protein
MNITPYLTPTDREKLKEHKYAGGDAGIIYPYFWDPFAKKLVEYIPRWVA